MLRTSLIIKCQYCKKSNTLDDWNKLSKKMCINREMRKSYTELTDKRVFTGKKEAYYICPSCGKWSKGDELIVYDEDNNRLNYLGGHVNIGSEYILTINNRQNKK